MRKDSGYGEKIGGMEPKKIYCTRLVFYEKNSEFLAVDYAALIVNVGSCM